MVSSRDDATKEIRRLVASGVEARRNGDLSTADRDLVKAKELAERSNNAADQTLAGLELASLRHDQLKTDEAISLYEKAVEKTAQEYGDKSLAYAVAVNNFGQLLSAVGRYDKARPMIEKAVSSAEVDPKADREYFNIPNTAAMLCRREGKLDEAIKHYDLILTGIEKKKVNDPVLTVSLCLNLGVAMAEGSHLKPAEVSCKKALSLLDDLGALETLPAAATFNAMARLEIRQGDLLEAKTFATKAIEISEQKLGKEHPHTATALETRADVLLEEGKANEALTALSRVLEVRSKKLGKDHQLVAEALARRTKAEVALKQVEQAKASFAQSHKILTARFGETLPPAYKWIAEDYATLLRANGQDEEARKVVAGVRPARPI